MVSPSFSKATEPFISIALIEDEKQNSNSVSGRSYLQSFEGFGFEAVQVVQVGKTLTVKGIPNYLKYPQESIRSSGSSFLPNQSAEIATRKS